MPRLLTSWLTVEVVLPRSDVGGGRGQCTTRWSGALQREHTCRSIHDPQQLFRFHPRQISAREERGRKECRTGSNNGEESEARKDTDTKTLIHMPIDMSTHSRHMNNLQFYTQCLDLLTFEGEFVRFLSELMANQKQCSTLK